MRKRGVVIESSVVYVMGQPATVGDPVVLVVEIVVVVVVVAHVRPWDLTESVDEVVASAVVARNSRAKCWDVMGDVRAVEDLAVRRNDRQSCHFVEAAQTVVQG